jgi:hypothetical protein
MATNMNLAKKGGEASANRVLKSFRMPKSLIAQCEAIAAEEGKSFSDVVVGAIETGLLQQAVFDLVRQSTAKVAALNHQTDLVSQVLGDIDTKLDKVVDSVKSCR